MRRRNLHGFRGEARLGDPAFGGAPVVRGFGVSGPMRVKIDRMGPEGIGKFLIGGAVVLLVVGGIFLLLGRFGFDRLPGDLTFRRGNFSLYFPIGLMIVLSIVGTIVLNILFRR
jgi:hypothetical protein